MVTVAAWLDRTLRSRVAIGVVVIAIAIHCGIVASRRMADFRVYHQAAQRLIAGEPIYRLDDPHRYLYAPVVTFLFVPLAPLPKIPAAIVWYAANLWLVVASLRLIERMVYRDARPPPGFRWLLVLFGLRFIDNNLGHGQINILLLWLVLVAYDAAGRGRTAWAGVALASA
ncbi:MAG: glycosyltransferase family 87 protein, partial [Candidatus Binatia bacterium]